MNRRKFLESLVRNALTLTASPTLVSLVGCSEEKNPPPKEIVISNTNYLVANGVINQKGNKADSFKLGVLADTHAHSDNTRFFAEQLTKEKVNAFLLAGDLSWSFGDYEGSKDDYQEIISVVESVAKTGKLVLTFPGNHEQKATYSKALEDLEKNYNNIVDMEKVPVADLCGVTIVGLGGSDNPRFNVPSGYLREGNDFKRLEELCKKYQKDKPLLIATHIPQRYSTSRGLDMVEIGKINVGGTDLRKVRKVLNSQFSVSGHIHEAYGIITPDEEIVKAGELSDKIDFNPGAVFDHLQRKNLKPAAGILEFVGNRARAYILNR